MLVNKTSSICMEKTIPLLVLIYGSATAYIIFPFNAHSHFRQLKT